MGENIRRPLADYPYEEEEASPEIVEGLAGGEARASNARNANGYAGGYAAEPGAAPLVSPPPDPTGMEPIPLRNGTGIGANGTNGGASRNGRGSLHDRIRQETSGFNFQALTHQKVEETPEVSARPTPPPAYAPFGMLEEESVLEQQELPASMPAPPSYIEQAAQYDAPPDVLDTIEAPPVPTDYALVNEKTGRRYRLKTGPNTIGREHCDIRLKDSTVSRRHAQVTIQQGQIYLVDTGSRNGTLLNGSRMAANEPVSIMDGAVIRMGNTLLSLAWMPEPPSPMVEPLPFVLPEFPPVTPEGGPGVVSKYGSHDASEVLEPQGQRDFGETLEEATPEVSGKKAKRPREEGRNSRVALVLSLLFLVFALAVAAYVLNGTIKDWSNG